MDGELVYNDELTARKWALNSAVECHPHTVEVIGSNPIAPTIPIFRRVNNLQVRHCSLRRLSSPIAGPTDREGFCKMSSLSRVGLETAAKRVQLLPRVLLYVIPNPSGANECHPRWIFLIHFQKSVDDSRFFVFTQCA